ncbi:hypothetical protein ACWGOQ_0010600 [Aquimarina sp. M1]
MVVIDKLYGNAERNNEDSSLSQELTPFDIFISHTETELPVPERIAKTAKESALNNSGRYIMNI